MAEWTTIYDKKLVEVQEQQVKVLKQQSKILQGQQKFTEVLAVATCILAIGTIIHLYFYVIFGSSSRIMAMILGGVIGLLSGMVFYWLFNTWGVFKSKKKKSV